MSSSVPRPCEDFLVSSVAKGKADRADALRAAIRAFGDTPETTEQLIVGLQNAMQIWKHMQTSFLDLVKYGTADMVRQALVAGRPDPNTPSTHSAEQTYPITEAVRRGDSGIVREMINSGRVNLLVVDTMCSGGCGIGTSQLTSPLAEAIIQRFKDIAIMIIDAHPDIEADRAFSVKSTFEGDSEKSIIQLANEWGNVEVVEKIRAKIAAKKKT